MPIWPPVMAGKSNDNKQYQGDWLHGWSPFIYSGIMNWLHDMLFVFRCKVTGHLGGHLVICCVSFGGCLAGCCACASPGEILYMLPKLATMSALCSWHVHCLGQVIWWSDRNRQGLLTESIYMCLL